jgi:hypothetical protein
MPENNCSFYTTCERGQCLESSLQSCSNRAYSADSGKKRFRTDSVVRCQQSVIMWNEVLSFACTLYRDSKTLA